MGYSIGIDSGSTFSKAVIMKDKQILSYCIESTGWQPSKTAAEQIEKLCTQHGITSDECKIITTGYGRNNILNSHKSITEITCHAKGGAYLLEGAQAILDIGGQDSKVIGIRNGSADNFLMNDKCAAGTGKFLSMICDRLEIPFDRMNEYTNLETPAKINTMCAVFAESEIIGLIAGGETRENILGGVTVSISDKAIQLINKLGIPPKSTILFTGGLSQIEVVRQTVEKRSGHTVLSHKMSVFAGAIGAALAAN